MSSGCHICTKQKNEKLLTNDFKKSQELLHFITTEFLHMYGHDISRL